MAHLKYIKSLSQPCFAFIEQSAHLTLTEKVLDFTANLLCFDKCMNFV
jgi:hypothetical protein